MQDRFSNGILISCLDKQNTAYNINKTCTTDFAVLWTSSAIILQICTLKIKELTNKLGTKTRFYNIDGYSTMISDLLEPMVVPQS